MKLITCAVVAASMLTVGSASAADEVFAESPEGKGSYRLTPTLSIGGPDAEEPAQFYERLGSVAIDADGQGNLYVLDNGNIRIQVFGADGTFLRTIGAEGEGPGEFQMPSRFSVNAAGDVAVFDLATQRITLFDANGAVVRDQLAEGSVRDLILRDDRSLLCSMAGDVPLVAYDSDGEIDWDYGRKTPDGNRMGMTIEINMSAVSSKLAESSGAVWLGSEDEYGVSKIASGQLAATFARDFERVPMELPELGGESDDDEEGGTRVVMITRETTGGAGESHPGGGGGGSFTMSDGGGTIDLSQIRNALPQFQTDIRGLLVWPDERIWVVTAAGNEDVLTTDEWRADGTYARSFELPAYDRFAIGQDGNLYAVGHDDDDYPIVYRLNVESVES